MTAKLDLAHAPPRSTAKLSIQGFAKGQTGTVGGIPLAVQIGAPDASGKLSLQATAKAIKNLEHYRIEGLLEHDGTIVFRKEVTLP